MNNFVGLLYKSVIIFFLILVAPYSINAQVNVTVTINSGSSTTTCTDGLLGGGPEPHWRINVAGQGWTTYPESGGFPNCFTNPPNQQYNQNFVCSYPNTLQVCIRAFEDDGAACIVSESCLVEFCDNFAVPAPGGSTNYNINVGGSSTATANFTINVTGSLVIPPTNDDICNAAAINPNGTVYSVNNTCASLEAGEPSSPEGGISASNTTWHSFVAPNNTLVAISTDHGGTNFDTEISLWHQTTGTTSCAFGSLSHVDSDDDIILVFNENSYMEVQCLTAGDTYYIQVDGNDSDDVGTYEISVNGIGAPFNANDFCADAIDLGTLSPGGTIGGTNYNNYCATSAGDPPVSWTNNQAVWFQFTTSATPGSVISIDAINSGGDDINLEYSLFSGSCGSLTEFTDIDYDILAITDEEGDANCLEPNTTYYLLVDGAPFLLLNDYIEGTFDISISDNGILSATNDDCADTGNIIDLGTVPFGGTIGDENNTIYNNYCASPDPQPADWTANQGVWFSFTTGANVGTILTIELEPQGGPVPLFGDIDLQASIFEYNGDCNTMIEVADGVDILDVTYDETVYLECPQPLTTYYLLVDGSSIVPLYTDEEGNFGISITDDGIVQASDYICKSEDLGEPAPGAPVTTTIPLQSNICATGDLSDAPQPDPSPWTPANDTEQQGVWFEFTAPPSGSVNIGINSTADILNILEPFDLDVYVALYTTLDDVCDPAFTTSQLDFIDEQHSLFDPCGLDLSPNDAYDESFDVHCLNPGQSYWIMVDGDDNASLLSSEGLDGIEGYFTIEVSDLEEPPAPNNDICNAIAIDGGVQMTPGQVITLPNQSNHCADNFFEPYTIPDQIIARSTLL